jgi:serine/threonine protein phosphatase PrpC
MVNQEGIHSASLGDSRALLATSKTPSQVPVVKAQNFDEKKHLYLDKSSLIPVQLTKDQKPEDPEEHARIRQCGGTIKKIVQNGKTTGPYRVVDSSGQYPLLAMSRSIGDATGAPLGVISTPISTFLAGSNNERFIVLGSDGIWDVMDNEDVVTFVETYRKQCLPEAPAPEQVFCNNTIIAHLLCEEARMRWMKVVAEEDALIDDISAVIVQFRENNLSP